MLSCEPCCVDGEGEPVQVLRAGGSYSEAPPIEAAGSAFVAVEPGDDDRPWVRFNVSLQKAAGELGMDVSAYDPHTLVVAKVRPGEAIDAWNGRRGLCAVDAVRGGDRIVELNGLRGAEKMLADLRSSSALSMTVFRTLLFTLSVAHLQGNPLGLFVRVLPTTLSVTRVDSSVFDRATRSGVPNCVGVPQMLHGDEIYEVNGVRGSGQSLMTALSLADMLQLKVRRPKVEPAVESMESAEPEVGC